MCPEGTLCQALLSSKRYRDRQDIVPTLETLSSSWGDTCQQTTSICTACCRSTKRAPEPNPCDTMPEMSEGRHPKEVWKDAQAQRTVWKDPKVWYD